MKPMTFQPEFEAWLGSALPSEYAAYLRSVNGGETTIADVLLYGADMLIERNETYETKRYCPGYFTIGGDGGGRAVVVRIADGSVHLVDHGAMTEEFMSPIDDSFQSWREANCPLPEEEEIDENGEGPAQLVLLNKGTASVPSIAKELRANLAIPLNEAMALARSESAALMNRKHHSTLEMESLAKILQQLGANVLLRKDD